MGLNSSLIFSAGKVNHETCIAIRPTSERGGKLELGGISLREITVAEL
jgi:hypothetical protein